MDIEKNTKAFLDSVFSVGEDNSIHEHLFHDTKTTPIMDAFYHSDKKFLIFDSIFSVGPYWKRVSLIIANRCRNVSVIDNGLTLTDLKKFAGTVIGNYLLSCYKETDRKYPLINELLKASTHITKAGDIVPFESPIRLGGQTYANQTGYGSEYNGNYQVRQGTLYGETTGFCIIGIIA